MRIASLCAVLLCGCVTVDPNISATSNVVDWRDEIIYQIMVDRFEDGDPNNNWNVDYRGAASYHGGDWQGIIDRLDYIETLGVTTLWISPVVKNVESDAGFASYHGYWTQDFMAVNPHFGDLSRMQALVKACHARGIKVVLDIVTNHIGQLFYYDINRNGQPDIVFFGGGGPGAGSRTADHPSDLRRASEWDPDYDSRGVQGFTSLGENGLAPVEWVDIPEINRTPPNPPEFRNPDWYNRKGRVTVWERPSTTRATCVEQANCDARAQCLDGGECAFSCSNGTCEPTYEYIREQEILGDFPGGLKDLATSRDDVRAALVKAFQYWIQVGDFDGFRIDTLKHQEPEFFDVFAPAMRRFAKAQGKKNFFMFGEAFDGNDSLLGEYTHGQGVDSVFYFSAKYQIFDDVFGRSRGTAQVQRLYEGREGDRGDGKPRYNDQPKADGPTDENGQGLSAQQLVVHFMDNHDVPRFLFDFPDVKIMRNALSFLLTTDGIPCIYYGTEQDFRGGPDPSNREDMWQSGFKTSGETFRYTQKLIALRKQYAPLRRGDLTFRWTTEHTGAEDDAGLLAFERAHEGERVLVVINTHNEKPARSVFDGAVMPTGFGGGAALTDVLGDGGTVNTAGDGSLDVTVPARTTRIFVQQ